MANDLYRMFHPITSTPFRANESYMEIAPCDALKPFIRCFWGTWATCNFAEQASEMESLVIPDACSDIMLSLYPNENRLVSGYCGLSTQPFVSGNQNVGKYSSFNIRFYFWAAPFFAADTLRDTCNRHLSTEACFGAIQRELEEAIVQFSTLVERARAAEGILLRHLHNPRQSADWMNSIYTILRTKGNLPVGEIADYSGVGVRQLERIFKETIGISPKQATRLVRYQYLYQDSLQPDFDVQDAVLQYGFTDQPHLLREFRSLHMLSLSDARRHALQNGSVISFT